MLISFQQILGGKGKKSTFSDEQIYRDSISVTTYISKENDTCVRVYKSSKPMINKCVQMVLCYRTRERTSI